jgi:hypothetical protein
MRHLLLEVNPKMVAGDQRKKIALAIHPQCEKLRLPAATGNEYPEPA